MSVALTAFISYWTLAAADRLGRRMGDTGIHILTRFMGLLLMAIAVQFILSGLTAAGFGRTHQLKAIRLHARGGPEHLVYEDAPQPVLGAGDALVRVYATGITRTELTWDQTYQNPDGSPRIPTIPGHEISGVIESVTPGVQGSGTRRCGLWTHRFPSRRRCRGVRRGARLRISL